MSGVDVETLVAQITARVTSEVLAALSEPQVSIEDAYPDWNEYVDPNGVMEEGAYQAALSGAFDNETVVPFVSETPVEEPVANLQQPGHSPIRDRARGIIPGQTVVDDGPAPSGAKGNVLPIGASGAAGSRTTGSGFSPDPYTNGDWFVRNFQKDVLNQRRQPPAEDGVIMAGR